METIARFGIFKKNLRLAEERNARGAKNAKPNQKPETHGVTQFMDLTPQEFSKLYKGFTKSDLNENVTIVEKAEAASIDWNKKGALTPVKNQGQCGSCWAFSATEQLESQYYQAYGTLPLLAEQQMVSCDTSDAGCQGGNPISAWGYISGFGGQELEKNYPYTSGRTQQDGTCQASKPVAANVGSGYTLIASRKNQEANMLNQIQKSPMSVCVDATLWQTYTGGVITSSSGCGTQIDHAVQLTGYNAEGNYWIVRNSWSTQWGENGFVYVEYGGNNCGITSQATIVSVQKVAELAEKVMV